MDALHRQMVRMRNSGPGAEQASHQRRAQRHISFVLVKNISILSDMTRCTIYYKPHKLTVHANIGLGPETHRGESHWSTRSWHSRSPHAPVQRRARLPRTQRVPIVPWIAWQLPLTQSIPLLSAPVRARQHRCPSEHETCGYHAHTHLSARGALSVPLAAPIQCKKSGAAPSQPTFRGRASGAAAGAPPNARV